MSDDNLIWCLRQKRGIRVIEPNPNLSKAYLKKAISSLNTMTAAIKIEEPEWVSTTAYYARYFALYALLMKMGIKSEIHDCTINIAKLLVKNSILDGELVEDLDMAKQMRIDTQYYVATEFSSQSFESNVAGARKFVLETEKVIDNISSEKIQSVRDQLGALNRKV